MLKKKNKNKNNKKKKKKKKKKEKKKQSWESQLDMISEQVRQNRSVHAQEMARDCKSQI